MVQSIGYLFWAVYHDVAHGAQEHCLLTQLLQLHYHHTVGHHYPLVLGRPLAQVASNIAVSRVHAHRRRGRGCRHDIGELWENDTAMDGTQWKSEMRADGRLLGGGTSFAMVRKVTTAQADKVAARLMASDDFVI
jgi:hypothetical protein